MEKPFEFEKLMEQVHKPNRVNPEALATLEGVKITSDWTIVYPQTASIVLKNAAEDLQDYFAVSMNVSVALTNGTESAPKTIFLGVDETLGERDFRMQVLEDRIIILGCDDRAAAQGSFNLEDELNLNEAPIIAPCDTTRHMRFAFRTIFSGYGSKPMSDANLNMLAHHGITAICTGGSPDPEKAKKINEFIDRVEAYGMDAYTFGGGHKNTMHPDDEGAFEFYDAHYGQIAKNSPKLKGFVFVGESCEFPSKDPRTTGKPWRESLKDEKSSPGWFPCEDYPQFMSMLRDVIRSHSPNADIIFWTYNWGYQEQSLREKLVRAVPTDITMMATFEMFENVDISPEIQEVTTDYTLWQIGPGKYFTSESAIAKERDVKMYCMSNTGGNTWDIGGTPYLPSAQRWIERWRAVTKTQDEYRIDGLFESLSWGFFPTFLPEMTKQAYMSPDVDLHELLRRIIIRDYGKEHLEAVLKAYEMFSEGMSHCVSTNEDQYGPARVGPAYPLFFERWELIPPCPVTGKECNFEAFPVYTYNLDRSEKLLYEIDEYTAMARAFDAGCTILEGVINQMEGPKKATALHILQVASYIRNNAKTVYNVKRWHYLKGQLGIYVDADPTWVGGRKNMPDAKKAVKPLVPVEDKLPVVLELLEIIKDEIANAKATIPLVEENSRLGFNQEYGYSSDRFHLEWKIAMAERTIEEELLPLLNV